MFQLAPVSCSLWLDPQNYTDWHWSVHADVRVIKSGVAADYHTAFSQLKNAMDYAATVYGPKDENES